MGFWLVACRSVFRLPVAERGGSAANLFTSRIFVLRSRGFAFPRHFRRAHAFNCTAPGTWAAAHQSANSPGRARSATRGRARLLSSAELREIRHSDRDELQAFHQPRPP